MMLSPAMALRTAAMMVAMMLPSLWPALRRYHRTIGARGDSQAYCRTLAVATGYVGVWAAIGMAMFALDARVTPVAAPGIILAAGALQLTRWKARQLARCREVRQPTAGRSMSNFSSWADGVRLGFHCAMSCVAPMAVLLAIGLMDVRTMVVVTAAITAERLMPSGARVSRATGAIALGAGALMLFVGAG